MLQDFTQLKNTFVTKVIISQIKLLQKCEISQLEHLIDESYVTNIILGEVEGFAGLELHVTLELLIVKDTLDLSIILQLFVDSLKHVSIDLITLRYLHLLNVLILLHNLDHPLHLSVIDLIVSQIDMVDLGELPGKFLQKVQSLQPHPLPDTI